MWNAGEYILLRLFVLDSFILHWRRDQDGNNDAHKCSTPQDLLGQQYVANDWIDKDMLKRWPTLLSGKVFAVFERLAAVTKEDYKTLTKALIEAFGGNENGKHIAMMAFCNRMRKPEEDIQVFAYDLESPLRRAMPNIEKEDRNPPQRTIN